MSPIYEYKCTRCGKSEELLEPNWALTQHDCQFCDEKDGQQRVLSPSTFVILA